MPTTHKKKGNQNNNLEQLKQNMEHIDGWEVGDGAWVRLIGEYIDGWEVGDGAWEVGDGAWVRLIGEYIDGWEVGDGAWVRLIGK